MNTPNDTDIAALRAECDVLRFILARIVAAKIKRDYPPGVGLAAWCGLDMACEVTNLATDQGLSNELHVEAYDRFSCIVQETVEADCDAAIAAYERSKATLAAERGDC
jgi:hypothetical protein